MLVPFISVNTRNDARELAIFSKHRWTKQNHSAKHWNTQQNRFFFLKKTWGNAAMIFYQNDMQLHLLLCKQMISLPFSSPPPFVYMCSLNKPLSNSNSIPVKPQWFFTHIKCSDNTNLNRVPDFVPTMLHETLTVYEHMNWAHRLLKVVPFKKHIENSKGTHTRCHLHNKHLGNACTIYLPHLTGDKRTSKMLNKSLIFLGIGGHIKSLASKGKWKRKKYLKFLNKKSLKLQTLFKIFL